MEIDDPTTDETPPSLCSLITTFIALALSIFLVSLDMTIIATAIPHITHDFRSIEDVGWFGSAFFLTLAAFQSSWGKAFKYFDLKWCFLLAIGVFEVGSVVCGTY